MTFIFVNQNVACIYRFCHFTKCLISRLTEMFAIILTRIFFQEWGPISFNLYQVTVQIISDSECNSTYADFGGITDRMICAGDPNGDKGACPVRGS